METPRWNSVEHRCSTVAVTSNGSEPVIPGSQGGVEYATANDNKTAYFAVSNMGPDNFFPTHEDPIFSAKGNGLGNGTVTAVDINLFYQTIK